MSQPEFDTTSNCLEQVKDEIGVILEVDPTNFSTFFLSFLMFTLILTVFRNWILSHNDY